MHKKWEQCHECASHLMTKQARKKDVIINIPAGNKGETRQAHVTDWDHDEQQQVF